MQSFFSAEGQTRLTQIAQAGMLCVFDFDGTLAPITTNPDQARLSDEVLQRLVSLSEQATVAILTGRSVADIRKRLGFEPAYVIGNHGLEGIPGWETRMQQHAACCREWRSALTVSLLEHDDEAEGIWIEDKKFSLSVHYREAKEPVLAAARLAELFAALDPKPRVIAGKCVFNLLPQDAADKGQAMRHLLELTGAESAIYAGDDVTDEDVFRLLLPNLMSVRVEHDDHSAAEFFIPEHADIVRLLDALLCHVRSPAAKPQTLPDCTQNA